ncbi:MAG: DUF4249 family protein [Bacteroidales bacterium]|jgi:hypothetical protein|nr:DUF4249 family protein [Bacteroidales bacterium]
MKKIAALLYIFILIFTSCQEEVDYEDMGLKNIIVVNGRFIDGETPWCQVSRSDLIFDQIKNKITPTVFLPDANVTATDGDADYKYTVVADSAMMEAKGLIAKAGETYTLKAKANGLDDVYSTVTVPNKPKAEFRMVSNEQKTEIYDRGDFYYILPYEEQERQKDTTIYNEVTYELNIEDDPNTEDYYQIVFYANQMHYINETVLDTIDEYWADGKWIKIEPYIVTNYKAIDSFIVYGEVPYYLLKSNDPVMNWNKSQSEENIFDTYEWNEKNIFNDQLFNGQTSKIRFTMNISRGTNAYNYGVDINTLDYEVRHINKEMYMYYRTYQLVKDNDYNGTLSPYILYCNVENGAGMIAAWSAVKAPVKVPDQVK